MQRRRLLTLVYCVAAWVAFALPAPAAEPGLVERDNIWPQDYTDVKADPAVRFGTLPNGMRYAIMHNATPPEQVSLRMRVGAGSLDETDAQQGLAHFLEHMAFKGSKKVPGGDMVHMLERLGLAFGADTNASTSFDETAYRLDLPRADAATVDTGLMLMREVASELTLAADAMDHERGVVLSEERARDTPGYRASIDQMKFLLGQQLAAKRLPIGKVDVLKNAPIKELADYYRAHYRPELTTMVVVGDIDPKEIETKVKTLFGDWTNPTPPSPEPDLGRPGERPFSAGISVQPGIGTEVRIMWLNPYDNSADTVAIRKRETLRSLAYAIVNRRLETIAQSAEPPFLSAGVGRGDLIRSLEMVQLNVGSTPEDWKKSLFAADAARRQAVEFGVRQDELNREITEMRTSRQNAAARADTRRTPQLAGGLQGSAGGNYVFTTPQQSLALFEDAVKGVKVEDINAILRETFVGQGPVVFMSTSKPVEGGEAALLAAVREAEATPVTALAATKNKTWVYANSFGPSGKVASKREVKDLGLTFVRFANGTRLTVKPTTFTKNEILVSVRMGNGLLGMPADQAPPLWAASAFVTGGLKDLTFDEIQQIFSDKVVRISLGVGEDTIEMFGGTRPADLDTEMQLLAAYTIAPGYRPEAFERVRNSLLQRIDSFTTTPGGILGRDFGQLSHSGDLRWHTPNRADLMSAKPSDLPDLLRPSLTQGEVEIVMVGDLTVDRAIAAVAATFGAMPARLSLPPVKTKDRQVRFPAGTAEPVTLMHTGRKDQSVAILAWPTDDFFANPQRARAMRMLEQIMRLRMTDQFRVAEGNTYSPSTAFDASQVWPRYGFVMARIETPPDKLQHFFTDAALIAQKIAHEGVTEDEIQRAKRPRIEALEKAKETNGYWLGTLGGGQTDVRKLDAIRQVTTGIEKVTAADIKQVAEMYIRPEKAWKVMAVPEPAPN